MEVASEFVCSDGLTVFTQAVSEAAGQGVTITGDTHRNTWDWANSVIFASTIVTTIGSYGLYSTLLICQ